jgi:hypothetical protein
MGHGSGIVEWAQQVLFLSGPMALLHGVANWLPQRKLVGHTL